MVGVGWLVGGVGGWVVGFVAGLLGLGRVRMVIVGTHVTYIFACGLVVAVPPTELLESSKVEVFALLPTSTKFGGGVFGGHFKFAKSGGAQGFLKRKEVFQHPCVSDSIVGDGRVTFKFVGEIVSCLEMD